MVTDRNFHPGNTVILIYDIGLPISLWALLLGGNLPDAAPARWWICSGRGAGRRSALLRYGFTPRPGARYGFCAPTPPRPGAGVGLGFDTALRAYSPAAGGAGVGSRYGATAGDDGTPAGSVGHGRQTGSRGCYWPVTIVPTLGGSGRMSPIAGGCPPQL